MTSKQNGGYRSPSGRSRNRSRTRSYDSYDDYSDSFESEAEVDIKKTSPSSKKPVTKKQATGNHRAKNSKTTPKGKGLKNGRGSTQNASPRDMDAVARRMLSARRLKVNELRNQVEELNQLVQDLKLENRTIKQESRRQDKALTRYEEQEGELPSLLSRHNEEVRILRDQIKRNKEKYESIHRRYKELDEELHRTRKQQKKLKELADNKKLGERDELARKLTQSEIELDEKDKKIRDLERYIDNLQKNQRHELAIEIHRHRETQRRVAHLEDMVQGLETQVKEKEKILDIKNIYSNRIVRPPHKLPSGSSTPLSLRRNKRSSLSDQGTTPREKMRQYEDKRRQEEKKQREDRERRKNDLIQRNNEYSNRNSVVQAEIEEEVYNSAEWQYKKDKERWDAEEEEKRRMAEELDEARRREREIQEAKDRARQEERERWERERAEEELRRRHEREENERREREERQRREQEEREWREREEEERRYRREKEEQERREREEEARRERERWEREESERRAREEHERMEKDAQLQEERRKKDELLAKLRAIDNTENDDQNLFKQNKQIDKVKSEKSNVSSGSSRKSYQFTKPVENLHQGKPSHEDNTIPYIEKRRRSNNIDEDIPYQPSFSDDGDKKAKKKADLMKNLFGDSTVSLNKDQSTKRDTSQPEVEDLDDGNGFFLTKSNRRPSKEADLAFTFSTANRGKSENASSDSKLLPRRQSQQPTTITKPAVMAIDDPDDLEEVIL